MFRLNLRLKYFVKTIFDLIRFGCNWNKRGLSWAKLNFDKHLYNWWWRTLIKLSWFKDLETVEDEKAIHRIVLETLSLWPNFSRAMGTFIFVEEYSLTKILLTQIFFVPNLFLILIFWARTFFWTNLIVKTPTTTQLNLNLTWPWLG